MIAKMNVNFHLLFYIAHLEHVYDFVGKNAITYSSSLDLDMIWHHIIIIIIII